VQVREDKKELGEQGDALLTKEGQGLVIGKGIVRDLPLTCTIKSRWHTEEEAEDQLAGEADSIEVKVVVRLLTQLTLRTTGTATTAITIVLQNEEDFLDNTALEDIEDLTRSTEDDYIKA